MVHIWKRLDGCRKAKSIFFLVLALIPAICQANCDPWNQCLYDKYRYSAMYYYGVTVSDSLFNIMEGQVSRWPEHIQTFEVAHTLPPDNFLRQLVRPLVGVVQFALNFAVRNGCKQNTIYEVDPYFAFRWANWPWNRDYINTSLAIGEGISYASSVPSLEKKGQKNNTKRLLNYLMLEATFALPKYPRLQLSARIHHRSGAFGLYQAGNTGSNVVGLGIRYLFDC